MKQLTGQFVFALLALMLIATAAAAVTVTVGSGTATSNNLPLRSTYDYSYSQQIYTQAQINQAGAIERIRLYFSAGSVANSSCWFIYLGHTTKTSFTSTTDWVPFSQLTKVFDGTITAPVIGAWHEIILETPFQYNNVNNLVVAIDENDYNVAGTRASWRSFTSGTNTGIYKHFDTTSAYENDINPMSAGTATGRTSNINQIQFEINPSYLVSPLSVTRMSYINDTRSSDLTITNIGASNLSITAISGSASWLSYSFTPTVTVTPGNDFVLPLNFTAPATAGTYTVNLSITTSAGTITVPVGIKTIATAVPTNPRHIAQWEPARGALIRYPLGIPDNLVLDLANNGDSLYCVVSSANYTTAYNYFQNTIGISPMSKVNWIIAANDSYWARDWGPISVYEDDGSGGRRLALIDFDYNRDNRPNDELLNPIIAADIGVPSYTIPMSLTGGNILTDGLYQEFANEEVYYQNDGDTNTGEMDNLNEKFAYTLTEFEDLVEMFRGDLWEDGFHSFIDPLKDYIHHIDTWAKLISVDRVIIADGKPDAEVDAALDILAGIWGSMTASNGNLYTVYRVQEPNNEPYTNAYILNNRVYIPFMGTAATDNAALTVWQNAMNAAKPGFYTVTGYTSRTGAAWVATDAIHCRVHTIYALDEDPTPVELSSFTAAISATNNVMLTWVTQTETNVAGFRIYRGTTDNLAEAIDLNVFIQATNTSQTQTYVHHDTELYEDGTYYYWLENQDMDGSSQSYGPVSINVNLNLNPGTPEIPIITGINSIYPNPFNPSSTIAFGLKDRGEVQIKVWNTRGQLIRDVYRNTLDKGYHAVVWDGKNNSGDDCGSGLYFFELVAGSERSIRKAVLMK